MHSFSGNDQGGKPLESRKHTYGNTPFIHIAPFIPIKMKRGPYLKGKGCSGALSVRFFFFHIKATATDLPLGRDLSETVFIGTGIGRVAALGADERHRRRGL